MKTCVSSCLQVSVEGVLAILKANSHYALNLLLDIIPKMADKDWTHIVKAKQVSEALEFWGTKHPLWRFVLLCNNYNFIGIIIIYKVIAGRAGYKRPKGGTGTKKWNY